MYSNWIDFVDQCGADKHFLVNLSNYEVTLNIDDERAIMRREIYNKAY